MGVPERADLVCRRGCRQVGIEDNVEAVAVSGEFELGMDQLRSVVRFAAVNAAPLLALYESCEPGDPRPRAALDAAWLFEDGGRRSALQRTAASAAHRAARQAGSEPARLAALACGDAAAAAYLHPIARATQVGHIVRSAACAVLVAQLLEGDAGASAAAARVRSSATDELRAVLRRYPPAPRGRAALARVMSDLDEQLRNTGSISQGDP